MSEAPSLATQIKTLLLEAERLKEHIRDKNEELMRLAEIINRMQMRAEMSDLSSRQDSALKQTRASNRKKSD